MSHKPHWTDRIKKAFNIHVHNWTAWKYESEKKNMLGWIEHGGARYERKYTAIRENRVRTCKDCGYIDTHLVQYREQERD